MTTRMTGAQIAALVDVPADNAVVRRDNGPDRSEIGVNDPVEIHAGDRFIVTRGTVDGGAQPAPLHQVPSPTGTMVETGEGIAAAVSDGQSDGGTVTLTDDATDDAWRPRVVRELDTLRVNGVPVALRSGPRPAVIFYNVPINHGSEGGTDVAVPVPDGYPAGRIDLAALPLDSPLIARVKGGSNPQGRFDADGRTWLLASYHPHEGRRGEPWDDNRHGFHTYYGHLLSWFACLA